MRNWIRDQASNLVVVLLILLFLVVFFAKRIFIPVNAGQSAVYFRRFFGGVVMTRVYGEGLQIIFPWDTMTVYDLRVQERSLTYNVLTANGLTVTLVVSARFHPHPSSLPLLHQRIGPDYIKRVVVPVVESSVRSTVGEHTASDVYANNTLVIHKINSGASAELAENYIVLDDLVIRRVKLPTAIEDAIEMKEEQRELLEAYAHRLRREKQEAFRKEIEAIGWQNFNTLIGQSLTPRLLQWRGIEATRELANSTNAKVVVVGNGEHGLPVILGSDVNGGGSASGQAAGGQVYSLSQMDARLAKTEELFTKMLRANNPEPSLTTPPPATSAPPVSPSPSPSLSPSLPPATPAPTVVNGTTNP